MNIFKVGDKKKAVCETCQSLTDATFLLRNVPFSDGSGIVKKVLAGVCDKCDEVVLIPHQSTPAIKKQMDVQKKAVETRVPAHMVDMLNLASMELGGSTDFSNALIKYYLHNLSEDKTSVKSLTKYLKSDLAKGEAQKRISLKGRQVSQEINNIKIKTSIKSTTDVLKAVVLKINDDVFIHPKTQIINNLKGVAAAFA
ncbi:hypothetical protein L0668_14710 [Paraglaciecola aquimarina]|uniref:HNH endonuclease 5 domain-containing protein n=1 Tax=Paraglaciecola algarum TaxID=3050085 RepID=A0ABS9D8S6_9ALTE|nr:hypothetical protein [Paraglaciecola sp. G1-23]MCF2949368.1 hypothetical protein [Paraglaciecola sp. G1-23]